MLWTLFLFIIILAAVIAVTYPVPAGIGYLITLAWVVLLIYIIFFRKDEVSRMLEGQST
jgi:uncharacterized protein (DUF58 family)